MTKLSTPYLIESFELALPAQAVFGYVATIMFELAYVNTRCRVTRTRYDAHGRLVKNPTIRYFPTYDQAREHTERQVRKLEAQGWE